MKIKNKLTLIFTLFVAVILVCLNFYIYFFTRSFTRNNFFNQLKDRANITATVFLEADEESTNVIESFQKKYLHALPDEIIRVYNDNNQPAYIDSSATFNFNTVIIKRIRSQKEVRVDDGKRQILGIYYEDNQGNFVIIASAIDEAGINNLDRLKSVLIFGFLISIVVLFFAGRYFTKLMLKPVSDISEQANQISETNLHLRLSEGNKKDELAELSIIINHMLERLENGFELQKSFVANASHELRTPLTSIIGNIEVTLTRTRTVEEHKNVLASIMTEAEKLHELTNGLLKLAQSNMVMTNSPKEEIRLDELLLELKDELKVKRPLNVIEIIFPEMPENPSALVIKGDKNLIATALLNILDNACKFSINQNISANLLLVDNDIIIKIIDKGIGIHRDELPHVIETFFRGGNARSYSGSGIGLALADKIISLHGGILKIESELNAGTVATVIFPGL